MCDFPEYQLLDMGEITFATNIVAIQLLDDPGCGG